MPLTVAPVCRAASFTVPKIGMPSKSSPAFFGFTPATKQFFPFAYSLPMRVWNCPVLPVMPWVMTLVSLLIRMLMASLSPGGFYDLLGCVSHVRCRNDGKARLSEYLLAELDVRAF